MTKQQRAFLAIAITGLTGFLQSAIPDKDYFVKLLEELRIFAKALREDKDE